MKKTHHPSLNFAYFIIIVLILFAEKPEMPLAQSRTTNCASSITPRQDDLGYKDRDRGTRCEGFYEASTGDELEVVSLLNIELSYDLHDSVRLQVTSPFVTRRAVHVQAKAIPLRTYYLMDSELSPNDTLLWPVKDVLIKGGLSANAIGVLGLLMIQHETKYVPLNVKQVGAPEHDKIDEVLLIVRSDIEVELVRWRYSEVIEGERSKPCDWLKAPPAYAGRPIKMVLPKNGASELFIEVSARTKMKKWLKRKFAVLMSDL